MTRVLVVDDSLTVRKRLVELLAADATLDVVGEASTGEEAIDLCRALGPDVITLDMALPRMSGLQVTEHVMAHMPTPILIVSASVNRGELYDTYQALAAGAVDVLDKLPAHLDDESWGRQLVERVKLVSKIRVVTHVRALRQARRLELPTLPAPDVAPNLLAIGASTGGPGAVHELLRALPGDFPVPVLVVMHVSEPFGAALAEWLDDLLPFEVREARDGETLAPRGACVVRLAPAGRHLLVRGGRLCLADTPPRHSCRPSVDELFLSLAQELGPRAIGCLLTGMGRDGAAGLLALRQSGAVTMAQDQDSSVVWGMPGEAVKLEAARHVIDPRSMAAVCARLARGGP